MKKEEELIESQEIQGEPTEGLSGLIRETIKDMNKINATKLTATFDNCKSYENYSIRLIVSKHPFVED